MTVMLHQTQNQVPGLGDDALIKGHEVTIIPVVPLIFQGRDQTELQNYCNS